MTTTESPILTAHLFPELDGALVSLLRSLTREEWQTPTIVPKWNVHQVAAHLLDTALRRLSMCRDGWFPAVAPPQSAADLRDLINRLNSEGVQTLGRYSPELLTAMTELVTPQLAAYVAALDPMAPASFPVSWAGETSSANWFDIARELTERWHHQQQIRLAVSRPGIMTPRLYRPVLDTFMRVLPYTYRETDAAVGTACDVVVTGACGGRWRLQRESERWALVDPDGRQPVAATVTMREDAAWRLFTRGLRAAAARTELTIHGDERLGSVVFNALAIVG